MRSGILLSGIVAFMLSACGGGGGNPGTCMASAITCAQVSGSGAPAAPVPASPPAGLYRGTSADGRTAAALVRQSGALWVIYSGAGAATLIAGAAQGTATFANGTFSVPDLRDFSVERQAISNGTMTGTYAANSTVNGTATFSASSLSFTATFDVSSTQAPTLSTIAGLYSGTAATLGGTESTSFTIAPDGSVTGSTPSGCAFAGSAVPESTINAYDVSVTFRGGACSNGNATVTGVAYYDAGVQRLTAAALNGDRSNGFILSATK